MSGGCLLRVVYYPSEFIGAKTDSMRSSRTRHDGITDAYYARK